MGDGAAAPPAPPPWKWTLRPIFLFGSQRTPATEEEEEAVASTAAPPPPPACPATHDHHALTLVFDALPPRALAGPAASACRAWREAAVAGDAWRARFRPPLPRSLAARLDAAEAAAGDSTRHAPPWPAAWAALAHTNLLRGPASWAGVATSMRSWMRATQPLPWAVTAHGGHGWAVEFADPAGAPPPPVPPLPPPDAPAGAAPPPFGAIASSFAWCEVVQVVDLVAALVRGRGWEPAAAAAWLDAGPTLELGVWVGGREDVPAESRGRAVAGLVLLDGEEVLPPYGPRMDWAGRGVAAWGSGERVAPAGGWARLVGRVAAPVARAGGGGGGGDKRPTLGARRALVYLRGRDTAFWAGAYGAKFAAPSLRFVPGGEVALDPDDAAAMEAALPVAPAGFGGPGGPGGFRLAGRELMLV